MHGWWAVAVREKAGLPPCDRKFCLAAARPGERGRREDPFPSALHVGAGTHGILAWQSIAYGLLLCKMPGIFLPIQNDLNHIHKDPTTNRDMGIHFHGPNGQKYFPDCNRMMDANGKVRDAGNFGKRFSKAFDTQIKSAKLRNLLRGGGLGMVLAAVASLNPDKAAARDLRNAVVEYEMAKNSGAYSAQEIQAVCTRAATSAQELYGNAPALWIYNELIDGS